MRPLSFLRHLLLVSMACATHTLFYSPSATAQTQGCLSPSDGLISWWPGDGTARDLLNRNDGILINGTSFAPGFVGQALSFDGNDDMVLVPDDETLRPSQVTVMAWVKFASLDSRLFGGANLPGMQYLVFKRNSRLSFFEDYTLLKFRQSPGFDRIDFDVTSAGGIQRGAGSTTNIIANQWYHVAGTYDGATIRIYINGALERETFHGLPLDHSTQPLVIGRSGQDGEPGEANWDAAFHGQLDEVAIYSRALSSAEIAAIYDAGAAGICKTGSVAGVVTADCPEPGSGLYGVRIDAFQAGTGDLVGTAATDATGHYEIPDLAAGEYTVTCVAPLGHVAASQDVSAGVTMGAVATVDFAMTCVAVSGGPRGSGFWKHQLGVATGGRGQADIEPASLCSYLDLIAAHFNTNAVNQVVVYEPPNSELCADKLLSARELLNLTGSVAMIDRARQQLMALLLNVAAGYVGLGDVASADGATVSQAITFCDNLIDNPAGNYGLAKTIAELINSGRSVPVNTIPAGTQNIAYVHAEDGVEFVLSPNPASGWRSFGFVLGHEVPVDLGIFDVAGRRVANVYRGTLGPGRHTVRWNGRQVGGGTLHQGLYLARLSADGNQYTVKLVQTTP